MKSRILFIMLLFFSVASAGIAQTVEKGKATYYSSKMSGRRTSSGERYNPNDFTCAHKTHPFGTKLRVYWPKTGNEVVVRVTDRGPFGKGFIIDLSYAAAKKLGILRCGVAPVEVSVVDVETPLSEADVASQDCATALQEADTLPKSGASVQPARTTKKYSYKRNSSKRRKSTKR